MSVLIARYRKGKSHAFTRQTKSGYSIGSACGGPWRKWYEIRWEDDPELECQKCRRIIEKQQAEEQK